jgi:DNA-binding NtrC family response regulator
MAQIRARAEATVLLVDDEPRVHETVARHLQRTPGVRLVGAYNAFVARERLATECVDVVLLDLDLPDQRGEQFLRGLGEDISSGRLEVIMLTVTQDFAIAAMCGRLGAFRYVVKAAEGFAELPTHLADALANRHMRRAEADALERALAQSFVTQMLRSTVPGVVRLVERIHRGAAERAPLLIEAKPSQHGRVVARYLHDQSPLHDRAFIEARGHRGWNLQAGGTLLVSDLDGLSTAERGLVAEAARSPGARVMTIVEHAARARQRHPWLNAASEPLRLVSLADRRQDLPMLIEWWQDCHAERFEISRQALEAMSAYDWPGDMLELERLLSALAATRKLYGPRVELHELPSLIAGALFEQRRGDVSYERIMAEYEKGLLDRVIADADGNKHEAARRLGIEHKRLSRHVKRLNEWFASHGGAPGEDDES